MYRCHDRIQLLYFFNSGKITTGRIDIKILKRDLPKLVYELNFSGHNQFSIVTSTLMTSENYILMIALR